MSATIAIPAPVAEVQTPTLDRGGRDSSIPNQPSMDSLREKAFSGMDSFLQTEEPKSGAGRIVLLIALLAALGAAGWWTYTNYIGAAGSAESAAAGTSANPNDGDKPAAIPAARDAAPASTMPSHSIAPPVAASERPSNGATGDEGSDNNAKASVPTPAPKVAASAVVTSKKPAAVAKSSLKSSPVVPPAKASATPTAVDTGDAAFRKGEAYLYGHGVPENCDEAVRNLKAASAKSSAKARSAFGTMYATGHCVQRDLPTSYTWFAMALQVDPNNQILEKDLSAVWKEMTPPERQMATRMKE